MNIRLVDKWATKTSNGMLSKGIYEIDGELYYVKGNSLNDNDEKGYEPYSEVMAYQIGSYLGIDVVPTYLADAYDFPDIITTGINHVSYTKNFLDAGEVWVPIYEVIENNNYKIEYMASSDLLAVIDSDFYGRYRDMFWLDALLGNEDRHLGNFGVIFKSMVPRMHPIFDNGACLLGMRTNYELKGRSILDYDRARPFEKTHRKQLEFLGIQWPSVSYKELINCIESTLELMPKNRADMLREYLKRRVR